MVHKISKYQREIIKKMKNQGAVIDCDEGGNYKVWLRFPNGKKEIVRKDTINSLSEKGAFKDYGAENGLKLNPYFYYEKK